MAGRPPWPRELQPPSLLVDGKASASALRYPPCSSASLRVPARTTRGPTRAQTGQHREARRRDSGRSPGTSAHRRRRGRALDRALRRRIDIASKRSTALARLDAAHGQEHEPAVQPCLLAHSDSSARVDRTEAGGIDTVVDDRRLYAELRLQPVAPVLAHDDQLIGLLDGLALTLDQRSSGEVVDVVDGADDADAGAGVSHPCSRTRRDAVLGVEDVCVGGYLGQPGLQVVNDAKLAPPSVAGRFGTRM